MYIKVLEKSKNKRYNANNYIRKERENMKKYVKCLILLIMMIVVATSVVVATYQPDKNQQTLKTGDVVYFDNSGSNWDDVTIYIFGNGEYKSWNERISMQLVEENIYSFTITEEIAAGNYTQVIFRNGTNNGFQQTKDLSYIEAGYAYKVTGNNGANSTGEWYLYDKTEVTNRLNTAKAYQLDKDYYTVESYGDLDAKIQEADAMLATEMNLKLDNTTGNFYIDFDYKMDEINTIINNLVVSSKVLEDKIIEVNDQWNKYEEKYTPSSLEILKEKIDNGDSIVNDVSKTVTQIKDAVVDIEVAIQGLVNQADKTELKQLIEEIESMDLLVYTEETVKTLGEVLTVAKTVSTDLDATQNSVDTQVEKLREAIDSLEKKPIVEEKNTNTSEENVIVNKDQISIAPKTGDMIGVFVIILIVAVIGLVIVTQYKKRESTK